MPAFCVVSDCELKYAHSGNVSFHKFPLNNPELLDRWIEFTDRGSNWKPSRWSSICSRHFISSDFRSFLSRRCLKQSAVPSVNAKKSPDYTSYQTIRSEVKRISDQGSDSELMKEQNVSKTLNGNRCTLCGHLYEDDADANGFLNIDDGSVYSMVRKCFPTTSIRHNTESPQICCDCSQLLRQFSDLIDKVMAYQKELQIKLNHMSEAPSETRLSGGRTAVGGCKEVSSIVIKQEPVNVKQETIDISNKRSVIIPDSNLSKSIIPTISSFYSDKVDNVEGSIAQTRVPGYISWFCDLCDRIFFNQVELESHMCQPAKDRSRDNSTNNNCEIMEIITLNNSVGFIDLADEEYIPLNGAMKVEHIGDLERRERVEYDHPYAKRIDAYHTKLKQEIHDDSSYSSDSNIELYNPSSNSLTVDLSNSVSGNESDMNPSSPNVLPDAEMMPNKLMFCQKCDICFENIEAFENHCRSMHTLKNKVCAICNADFKSVHDYLVHKNKMHAVGHQCILCRRTFAFKHALINHKRFSCAPIIADMIHICKHCNKRHQNRTKLNKHYKTCTSNSTKFRINNENCPNPVNPLHTTTIIKSENKNTIVCDVCGSQFSKRFNLNRHMKCHRPKDEGADKQENSNLQISENPSVLNSIDGSPILDDKVAVHSLVDINPVAARFRNSSYYPQQCLTAAKGGKSLVNPETHTYALLYKCETCSKAFQTYPNLKQHTITHQNERKFNCHLCTKVFKRSTGLNQHIRGFHYQIKPYSCSVCQYKYALKADMVRCRHSKLKKIKLYINTDIPL